jgi:hypothetical protein
MCYAEMTLVMATPDDTMPVAGFEHHTFMCSRCGDVETRLTFAKPAHNADADPASATIVPDAVAQRPDATGQGSRHSDPRLFLDVVTRLLRRAH